LSHDSFPFHSTAYPFDGYKPLLVGLFGKNLRCRTFHLPLSRSFFRVTLQLGPWASTSGQQAFMETEAFFPMTPALWAQVRPVAMFADGPITKIEKDLQ